ncbi:50S ribosomal protein L6 [Patescibacteria group bacterium]|nr:50S ribosomal protein L6 [Patescibacteria group bacterium]MBU4274925.1 50S ribosomal protein L6 [Patescibacteria group bacterium]MBU4367893.1 50S ribosomal protein L6 [Patescibacteria group bacterium]MBU4461930.1 50S ribosomal protein L6 [Patescibacteria group bacterium]MCG2699873.1 50S ribosomal protein L6 [Candidatus Parcubacteria bacterium]
MSRIGKKAILIPADAKIDIKEQEVKVSGPLGELTRKIDLAIKMEIKDGQILLLPRQKEYSKKIGAIWGLSRAILANMVIGVTKGFEKKLQIEGIGYKAALEGADLVLSVGFTSPVKIKCPPDIKLLVEKNIITVSGVDKEKVGQIAAIIKKVKKAEPYKGKGIKYVGEKIRRKEGKKVISAKT